MAFQSDKEEGKVSVGIRPKIQNLFKSRKNTLSSKYVYKFPIYAFLFQKKIRPLHYAIFRHKRK